MNKQETTGKQFYETADKIITVEKQEKSYSEEDTREKPLNQNKITAVEWLIEQIFLNKKYITYEESIIFEQAKEMEKQQIIDAANLQRSDYRGSNVYDKDGEQYYNETFKNETK